MGKAGGRQGPVRLEHMSVRDAASVVPHGEALVGQQRGGARWSAQHAATSALGVLIEDALDKRLVRALGQPALLAERRAKLVTFLMRALSSYGRLPHMAAFLIWPPSSYGRLLVEQGEDADGAAGATRQHVDARLVVGLFDLLPHDRLANVDVLRAYTLRDFLPIALRSSSNAMRCYGGGDTHPAWQPA